MLFCCLPLDFAGGMCIIKKEICKNRGETVRQYTVKGMSCAACQARVEKAVSALPGVESCAVSLLTNSMNVTGDVAPQEVILAVKKAGYGAKLQKAGQGTEQEEGISFDGRIAALKKRLIISLFFLAALMYLTMGHAMLSLPLPAFLKNSVTARAVLQLLLAAAVLLINREFFIGGFRALVGRSPNMDTLVALGSSVSFLWSVYILCKIIGMPAGAETEALYHRELHFESAAMIPALITVGKLLEAITKGKTTGAIKKLMQLKPKTARVLIDGKEIETPVEQVKPGDLFALRPGDSVPVDGEVTEGESAVDESALTGESVPVDKGAGDTVSAATVNRSGYLVCRATRVGEDTTFSKIIQTVLQAAATKAPVARIANKISGIFVPTVMAIALLVTAGWLFCGAAFSTALARGIAVLVISCPCALGLATPVAIMVGNGVGARRGILIKTGEALETVGKVKTVMLDKTGTITKGQPTVTDIVPAAGIGEETLLTLALSLEQKSEHPLALAVVSEGQKRGIAPVAVTEFRALSGNGVEAKANGKILRGGSRAYIAEKTKENAELFAVGDELADSGKTPLYFAEGETLCGLIAVADVVKETSAEAISLFRDLGLQVVMLTGDNEKTARFIGGQVGVDEIVAGVLPDRKEAAVRAFREKGKVAMVGDGINDAPALTGADVGIAIGAGTDIAVESASVVLIHNDLRGVADCVRLGRRTMRIIYQNLFWAFFYNLACIPLAAGLFGWQMDPMYAAAAMSISSVTVCLNALRLNLFR